MRANPARPEPLVVLHLITELDSGGAERMLTRIATHPFGRGGPRQIVVSLMDEGMHGPTLRAAGVELHCLGMRRGRLTPRAFVSLVRLMRETKPRLVMTWLYHSDLIGTLAAKIAGVRQVVWNVRGSDLDFSRYARTTKWTVRLLARLSRARGAIAINSLAGRRAHEALGYAPQRWVHLPNGFDLAEWRPDADDRRAVRSELGLADGDVAVGCVARVDPQKDYPALFAAAVRVVARHPEAKLVLIGRGTDELVPPEALAGRCLRLGERRDVARLLRGLDLVVLASAFGEGFPNAVGEAMATGLPCVVTDVGDAALIVGDTGIVVPPRDPGALADAICAMLERPPEDRELGLAARERIAGTYALDTVARAYRVLWEDIVVRP